MANQSHWSRVLTQEELDDRCGAGTRAWYAKATDDQILLQMGSAWHGNDGETYMVAKSYAILRGITEFAC